MVTGEVCTVVDVFIAEVTHAEIRTHVLGLVWRWVSRCTACELGPELQSYLIAASLEVDQAKGAVTVENEMLVSDNGLDRCSTPG